jgi:hypothetical protein
MGGSAAAGSSAFAGWLTATAEHTSNEHPNPSHRLRTANRGGRGTYLVKIVDDALVKISPCKQ